MTLWPLGSWAATRGIPAVLVSHERLDAILAPRVPSWMPLHRMADRWNQRLAAAFARVVCTSAFSRAEWERVGAAVDTVALGVDLRTFRPAPHRRRGVAELVCVGRLSREKRPDLAVDALADLITSGIAAHLTMVGGGPMQETLMGRARELPITFTGHVHDRARIAQLLGAADVAIAPCPAETFGLSVLEALACATPVVTTDRGAAKELLTPSCGVVAPVRPTALAAGIAKVLALPPSRGPRRCSPAGRAVPMGVHGGRHARRAPTPSSAAATRGGLMDRALLVLRPLGVDDDSAVRRLFDETVGLGRPLGFQVAAYRHYQGICLDWYLGPGRQDAAVALVGAEVCGYALVCTRQAEYEQWLRRRVMRFLVHTAVAALGRNESGRFLRLRIADGWHSWRHAFPSPMAAHAHLNVAPGSRGGGAARILVNHIDERCRLAHLPGWFGEMNAPAGHRAAALARLGTEVVHRVPNRTLSWLCGQPVDRLTVVRRLELGPSYGDEQPARLIA